MKKSIKPKTFSEVLTSLKHLGEYIRVARKRRRFSMTDVATRLNLSYQTVVRLEKGDPSVSIAAYMSALWLFGLQSRVTDAVHPDSDETGKALETSRLPERIGTKRKVNSEHDF
jgi:transcriptional regulator with XRE-family HTH domain